MVSYLERFKNNRTRSCKF